MNQQPVQISNELEDFVQGGIYPGGTGILEDIRYVLWDYEKTMPPDSVTAVRYTLKPTDGSNDNMAYVGYWTVGKAVEYSPDHTGGFLISHVTDHARMGSNWHFVLTKFRDNCGMERGRLSGPTGILALVGSEITLTRVDPPARDFAEAAPGMGPAQQGQKKPGGNKVLVPTRCKFPWEGQGKGKARGAVATPAQQSTGMGISIAPPINEPIASVNAPRATANGHTPVTSALTKAIQSVLDDASASGTPVPITDLASLLTPKLTVDAGFNKMDRINALKQVKEGGMGFLTALANQHGWVLDLEEPATLSK